MLEPVAKVCLRCPAVIEAVHASAAWRDPSRASMS
jgi:hypothetical protein